MTVDQGTAEKVDDDIDIYEITGEEGAATFANTTKPQETTLTLRGKKTMSGKDITDGMFSFGLYDEKGNPIDTADVTEAPDEDGYNIVFDEMTYGMEDLIDDNGEVMTSRIFTYTVKEELPENATEANGYKDKGIIYDHNVNTVKVKLSLVDGQLSAEVDSASSDEISFANSYTAEGSIQFTGVKSIDNRNLTSGETDQFTFELKEGSTVLGTAVNAADGKFSFDPVNYTLSDVGTHTYTISERALTTAQTQAGLSQKEGGTYTYTVRVKVTDEDGNGVLSTEILDSEYKDAEGNPKPFTFENHYESAVEVLLGGVKVLENKKLEKDKYEFELVEMTGEGLNTEGPVIATAKNNEDGSFRFDKIRFTQADVRRNEANGEYVRTMKRYQIREKSGSESGVVYDGNKQFVTVTLTELGNGTIQADVSRALAEVTFTNKYSASASVIFKGNKTLAGRALKKNEFIFELRDKAGALIQSAMNNADGTYSFTAIDYTLDDLDRDADGLPKETTKTYTIREYPGNDSTITYDDTIYTVQVTLKDNGDGSIGVEYNVDDITKFDFANTYESKGEITFGGIKTLENRNLKLEEFSFELVETNADWTDKQVLGTVKNGILSNSTGDFTFPKITYTRESLDKDENDLPIETKKYYVIREKAGSDAAVFYDDSVYKVTVTLTDNGKGTIDYVADNAPGSAHFTNKVTKISVSKKAVSGSDELPGAKIRILDASGNIVSVDGKELKWTSSDAPKEITGLKIGEEYTLRETVAPDGYTLATDIAFTIKEDGTVDTAAGTTTDAAGNVTVLVEDALTQVKISKVDVTDENEVAGAHIQILDAAGNLVILNGEAVEWDSATEPKQIEGLKTGVKYILREVTAPNGYTVTADTSFTIDASGKVTTTGSSTTGENNETILLVEDERTSVQISKVDATDQKELKGATISLYHYDSQNNKVVDDSWISGEGENVDDEGNIIPHTVKGLLTGVEYTLEETVAPEGYAIASKTTFTIDKYGKVTSNGTEVAGGHILIEDDLTEITVSKMDIAGSKELEGAELSILLDGDVVVLNAGEENEDTL